MDLLFNSVDVEILENVKLGVFVVYIMVFDFDMGYNGWVNCFVDGIVFIV